MTPARRDSWRSIATASGRAMRDLGRREAPPSAPAAAGEALPCSCGGRGWVIIPDGGVGAARKCSCALRPPEGDELRRRLVDAGLAPTEIDSAVNPDWRLGQYSPNVRADLEELVAAMWPTARPWLLSGLPGTGKTTAAARAAAAWIRGGRGPVAWVSLKTDLGAALDERMDRDYRGPYREDRWVRSALLVLDGLGDERANAARMDMLEELLHQRERSRERQALIVTTNADTWRDLVDGRIVSRLSGAREVEVKGPDWRQVLRTREAR